MRSDFFRLLIVIFHYSNALSLCSNKDKEHKVQEITQLIYNETTTNHNRSLGAGGVCNEIATNEVKYEM